MENVSAKLKEIFTEINTSLESLTEAIKRSPREIIVIAKIIEKGEKRIAKEYAKRMDEIKNLQHEIEVITEFATKMGYALYDNEPDETQETETETSTEPPTNGIKITIGDTSHDTN